MELTCKNFHVMIYYDFQRGLSRQECIDQLISTFVDEAPSYMPLCNADIASLIVATIRSTTNFVKIVQNQLLGQKTLMLCNN